MTDAPNLPDLQHWTQVMGRAQQMMMEQGLAALAPPAGAAPAIPGLTDPATLARTRDFWTESLSLWQRFLDPGTVPAAEGPARHRQAVQGTAVARAGVRPHPPELRPHRRSHAARGRRA